MPRAIRGLKTETLDKKIPRRQGIGEGRGGVAGGVTNRYLLPLSTRRRKSSQELGNSSRFGHVVLNPAGCVPSTHCNYCPDLPSPSSLGCSFCYHNAHCAPARANPSRAGSCRCASNFRSPWPHIRTVEKPGQARHPNHTLHSITHIIFEPQGTITGTC